MLRNEEGRDTDSNIKKEIEDVKALKIPLTKLAESPKASLDSIINQKPYKITAYFVFNHSGFQPSIPEDKRMFDWHLVFVEVIHRTKDE